MSAVASAAAAGEFTLGDVVAELNAEPEEPAEGTGGGAEGETEATDAPEPAPAKPAKGGKAAAPKPPEPKSRPQVKEAPKPAAPPEPGKLKEDFSDERPWTAARVKAAAAEAKALAESAQRQWFQQQKREEKLKGKRAEEYQERQRFLQERQQFAEVSRQFATEFQSLRTGGVRERIEAFGRLFGVEPQEFFEEFNVELARGGKKAAPSANERRIEAKLQRLEAMEEQRERQATVAHQEALIAQRHAELAEVGADAETYPLLSEYEPEEIGAALADVIVSVHTRTGRRISDAKAAEMVERNLQAREERRAAKRGDPKGSAGLATRAAAAAKPAQAQPPPTRGRSLAPRHSAAPAPTRELDDEELEDAADLIPASLLRAASPH